jgi:membrane-associated phospholipid phosphatase
MGQPVEAGDDAAVLRFRGEMGGPEAEQAAADLAGARASGWRRVFWLRVEEALALLFLLPTTYLTVTANLYARELNVAGSRQPGGLLRLAMATVFLLSLWTALKLWPRARLVRGLREVVPFLTCILIYTNLHDTISFVNPHDIHHYLIGVDQALFGVQPCVWAQQFITPARTDLMQFFYLNFFWIAPSTSLVLLLARRFREFRAATLGVVVCFYLGYFLYVALPAAPPRLVLVYEFTRNLQGYPSLLSNLSASAFALLPVDSRAAFPSLHAAVSLVALVYAFRHVRILFYLLLPFVLGLWVSTIYLRHHYVVDLIAGWLLVPVALFLAPRLDRFWSQEQRKAGYSPPLGA